MFWIGATQRPKHKEFQEERDSEFGEYLITSQMDQKISIASPGNNSFFSCSQDCHDSHRSTMPKSTSESNISGSDFDKNSNGSGKNFAPMKQERDSYARSRGSSHGFAQPMDHFEKSRDPNLRNTHLERF